MFWTGSCARPPLQRRAFCRACSRGGHEPSGDSRRRAGNPRRSAPTIPGCWPSPLPIRRNRPPSKPCSPRCKNSRLPRASAPRELREHRTTYADFGFDPPQTSLVIEAGDQRWQLQVGNRTAPGDQVFLRVVGVDGAFVADADWLKFIPRSAGDWRSTALVAADANDCDAIVLTNGAKVIELRRDRDEPSLAHDPSVAGARRQRPHHRRAATTADRAGRAVCHRRRRRI